MVGDRAKQTAIDPRLAGNGHLHAFQFSGKFLRSDQLLGCSFLEFGTLAFKFLHRDRRGTLGLALGDQEVAGIAVLDLDEIAEVTEIDDLFHQNNLHRLFLDYWWLSV